MKRQKSVYLLILPLIWMQLVLQGEARRGGAPEEVCVSMTPPHGRELVDGAFAVYTSSETYRPGETIQLALRSQINQGFRGFAIQARPVGSTVAVGYMAPVPSTRSFCNAGLTHTDPTEKYDLRFNWTAPPTPVGNIQFSTTFVQDYSTFRKVLSGVISPVPATMPSGPWGSSSQGVDPLTPALSLATDSRQGLNTFPVLSSAAPMTAANMDINNSTTTPSSQVNPPPASSWGIGNNPTAVSTTTQQVTLSSWTGVLSSVAMMTTAMPGNTWNGAAMGNPTMASSAGGINSWNGINLLTTTTTPVSTTTTNSLSGGSLGTPSAPSPVGSGMVSRGNVLGVDNSWSVSSMGNLPSTPMSPGVINSWNGVNAPESLATVTPRMEVLPENRVVSPRNGPIPVTWTVVDGGNFDNSASSTAAQNPMTSTNLTSSVIPNGSAGNSNLPPPATNSWAVTNTGIFNGVAGFNSIPTNSLSANGIPAAADTFNNSPVNTISFNGEPANTGPSNGGPTLATMPSGIPASPLNPNSAMPTSIASSAVPASGPATNMAVPVGSATNMAAPVGSANSMTGPSGSATSMVASLGSATNMASPLGSPTNMAAPVGSPTNMTGTVGSVTNMAGTMGSASVPAAAPASVFNTMETRAGQNSGSVWNSGLQPAMNQWQP